MFYLKINITLADKTLVIELGTAMAPSSESAPPIWQNSQLACVRTSLQTPCGSMFTAEPILPQLLSCESITLFMAFNRPFPPQGWRQKSKSFSFNKAGKYAAAKPTAASNDHPIDSGSQCHPRAQSTAICLTWINHHYAFPRAGIGQLFLRVTRTLGFCHLPCMDFLLNMFPADDLIMAWINPERTSKQKVGGSLNVTKQL